MFLLIILIIGFIMLIKGADVFVDGSSDLAKRFKVPGVIIGLTIVALGTSAPELAVSTAAALSGSNEIALSNVVGSNIFNCLSVLGVCAAISAVPIDKTIIKRDFPIFIISSILLTLAVVDTSLFTKEKSMNDNAGTLSKVIGATLVIGFILYIALLIADAKKHPTPDDGDTPSSLAKCIILIVIGLAFIIVGGKVVVYSAREIARSLGMTETLIGLTIVAVGTSLPELVTSIVASKKGESGLAVGNAIGSNIFNLLLILGVSSVINPIGVNVASVYDLCIMIVVTCITFIFAITKENISRLEGIMMVFMYVAYVAFAIIR